MRVLVVASGYRRRGVTVRPIGRCRRAGGVGRQGEGTPALQRCPIMALVSVNRTLSGDFPPTACRRDGVGVAVPPLAV